jgi:hypothetical protein
MKPDKALRIIRGANKKLAEAVEAAREEVAGIQAQERWSDEAKGAAVEARRRELSNESATIRDEATEALESLRGAAPKSDKLDPLEAGRIWRRLERRLDAGESPMSLAGQLTAEGDREAVQTLREELPDYLRAAGLEPRDLDRELRGVAAASTDAATDDEKAHAEAVATAERVAGIVTTNSGFVEKDGLETEQIFGETPEETIDIGAPA